MRRSAQIAAVLLICLAIAGYVFFNGERKVPIRYRTATVERGSVVSLVTATGTISPVVSVQVGTQVSGMIKSLHADFNSVVKAGDVVAIIDPEPFRARRDQAASNVEMARANLARSKTDQAQRRRELERTKSLLSQQFVSQNDVDVAVTNAQGAEAQVNLATAQAKQAEAALNAAELDLKYTTIRSPVNGIVVVRNVEVGQTVAASFATPNLFLIALDLTKMQVDTNVSESDIGGIVEGKEAVFTVDAYPGIPFSGTIRQIRLAPINIQNVVTYNVVVGVDNDDLRLKPGMTANVSIVVAQKDGILKVSNAALRFVPPKSEHPASVSSVGVSTGASDLPPSGTVPRMVWRQNENGDPVPLVVYAGISDGAFTEIASPTVGEGETVIVGIEPIRGARSSTDLPPGFGTSGQRRTRDRGM
ncbi:putative Efflux transporter, RND family, MFP subunit, Macrolide-specific efflux protein [Nitrospira sp. KM1]|uniref:efflux RND transporter periplasmic adaptor subunit n=1 Tax=Nitrospira sp. KM1 TaxID=1936990 RepID=UPI0013A71F84|nr:efflux RND transporter periplasmic adaptor subunit [Nitrospira sp. KM1]BCA56208.1 putative Efflux transporter, RND family, MFP subunit, Macrolide-specific efflux protein [Nitrospira sp. KM1]